MTNINIEIDAHEIVSDAADAVVEIMNDNIDIEGEVESALDQMDLSDWASSDLDIDNQVANAVAEEVADIDLTDAIQSTLKMNPEIVMGAIVEYARKESQQQITIEMLRGEIDDLKREVAHHKKVSDVYAADTNALRDELEGHREQVAKAHEDDDE